ncbi:hypothetical protein BGX31_007333 [Mortierella sp. GBA43]|nr:hypothetical protein BGX31_007333 [Mortierella sp. GBA43]
MMETETMILPPRTRLHELKISAEIPTEEFNHSIKTWVNMASLLVKQGNMAESTDDENAYISYVRACLIVTKIIPHQALYPSMMNDIVCIDLRQKILGIVARMVHLERRLLKRFEQENQELLATSTSTTRTGTTLSPSSAGKILTSSRPSERKAEADLEKQKDNEDKKPMSHQNDIKASEGHETGGETEDLVEIKYDIPASAMVFSESESRVNVTYHEKQQNLGRQQRRKTMATVNGTDRTILKKKSSNEDDRTLLTPGSQPNNLSPSTLFGKRREGHMRRCSSTDAIRNTFHFPPSFPPVIAPAVPPRSQKRASTVSMARTSSNNSSRSTNSISGHHKCNSEASMPVLEYKVGSSDEENRLFSKWTMSCESNTSNQSDSSASSSEATKYIAIPKIAQTYLKKSNSISYRNRADLPPTPRLSVENLPSAMEGSSTSSATLSAHTSISSPSSGSINPLSSASSTCSSPFTSPLLRTSSSQFATGHTYSLTSVLSGSTVTSSMDVLPRSLLSSSPSTASFTSSSTLASLSASDSSSSSSPVLNMEPQPQHKLTSVSSSSPTLNSMSNWSISGNTTATSSGSMKAGLLRKIRSRPKIKDQVFEIVVSPSLTPALSSQPPSSSSSGAMTPLHQQKLMV